MVLLVFFYLFRLFIDGILNVFVISVRVFT